MRAELKIFALLSFISILLPISAALAQVDTAWVRRYVGPAGGDLAKSVAIDTIGNVYVTGLSFGVGSSVDYATLKYAPNGDTLWARRYNGPGNFDDYAHALTVDDSGYVYVTGQSDGSGTGDDYATIKYAPNGDTLWISRYNGPLNSDDAAYALAVDDSGYVYVTGSSSASGTALDYATIKYASNGDTVWVRRYSGTATGGDEAYALAVDDSGNVYVTGYSVGSGTSQDYATIKYNANGDTAWVRRYNGPGSMADAAYALAVDDSGNVYVTGQSDAGFNYDYATIKYDRNGNSLWVKRYNGTGNLDDLAQALAVNEGDTVYVTGYSYGSSSLYDYTTIKYAPNGDTLWVRHYNGPGNDVDQARALALGDSGSVYVTGYSSGGGFNYDYATLKYDANGDTLWVKRYNGSGNDVDQASALALDDSGNVYITGNSIGSGTGDDYATIMYSPTTCIAIPGDANASGTLSLGDIIATVNYTFDKAGFPACVSNNKFCWLSELLCRGDWNGSGTVTLSDVIQGVNKLFSKPGGPWDALPSGLCCQPAP